MLLSSGKSIATVDASGVTLRNGKTFLWGNIVKIRSDLVIQLTKGKRRFLMSLSLKDLLKEAHK
jgi:hypothetical protein